jgi:hypothetical protein
VCVCRPAMNLITIAVRCRRRRECYLWVGGARKNHSSSGRPATSRASRAPAELRADEMIFRQDVRLHKVSQARRRHSAQ